MKQLVKAKIVLENDGKSLVTYLWKRTFLCFGYWYPFGSLSSSVKLSNRKLDKINDEAVAKLFNENFIKGF